MTDTTTLVSAAEATDAAVVSLGELTPQARRFAAEHGIRVLGAAELAVLLGGQ